MVNHYFEVKLRAIYDVEGKIVSYVPCDHRQSKEMNHSSIRAELYEQAKSHLESLSAVENEISYLTLTLKFQTKEHYRKILGNLFHFFRWRFSNQKDDAPPRLKRRSS
ncbi:hypothetical protein HYW75_04050 [Candidatus Pacearchaeota archaeon]|nr:hypothetical protein [Candidatus Pacearchaeota archaeon]